MPVWNKETKRYEEEPIGGERMADDAARREERFRTALLNQLDEILDAIRSLDFPSHVYGRD